MHRSVVYLVSFLSMTTVASGFVSPRRKSSATSIAMAIMDVPPPPPSTTVLSTIAPLSFDLQAPITTSSVFSKSIGNFRSQESHSTVMSSTNILSLKDRPPPPTAEEIAAKKQTFNLWFWGGGFVAPFLATFYYFGFKFWER